VRRARLELVLAFVLAAVYGAYLARSGPVMSPDSGWYADAGRALVRGGFRIGALLDHSPESSLPVFYVGFSYLVAGAQFLFPAHWMLAIAVVNAVSLAATAYLAMRLVRRAVASRFPVLVVFALFAGMHDQLQWVPYVLSDSTFQLLAFGMFALTVHGFGATGGARRYAYFVAAGAGAVAAVFCRPPGLVLCAWILFALAAAPRGEGARGPGLRRVAAGGAVLCAVALLAYAYLMAHGSGLGAPLGPAVEAVRAGMAGGGVVDARPETSMPPPRHTLDFVALIGWRLVYFFVFWARGFSTAHNVVNAAVFVPVYLLAGVALLSAFSARSRLPRGARDLAVLAAMYVGAVALFQALTLLDFDWRYRLPAAPALIVLAALGSHVLLSARRGPRGPALVMSEAQGKIAGFRGAPPE